MTAAEIITTYIKFFEDRGHKRIPNAPLVPENDPTTLFTSSGMQPLVPYLLGEPHPMGRRIVNVQNVFRTVDIDEIGNSRHLTFYRMLGNWSLGDYFKKEQLTWIFEFLTAKLGINPEKLFVTIFEGDPSVGIGRDEESIMLWKKLFESKGIQADIGTRIFPYGVKKNWWSRSGVPEKMPTGEPGGPDSEIFYDFGGALGFHEKSQWKNERCHVNCDCGRYWEISNNVFMQYQKQSDGSFIPLPQRNVDFGGGLERIIGATENQSDIFATSLFRPIVETIAKQTEKLYDTHKREMQIVTDHFGASMFITLNQIKPSNTDQGYLLRRLIRRGIDAYSQLGGKDIDPVLEKIAQQYRVTDPQVADNFEEIKNVILTEKQAYEETQNRARKFIEKKYSRVEQDLPSYPARELTGDELMGKKEISADDAFVLYTTHGLSPTQIENLGYLFDKQKFAEKMEEHQNLSRKGAAQKFSGGLADHEEKTIMGHTATHLLQQALRDILGNDVRQTGSNITTERLRFDFNYDQKLTDEQIKHLEDIVSRKIKEDLPVYFLMLPLQEAKELGAIGLFDEKYQETVKVYCIGSSPEYPQEAYSKEFCGGPHVDFTSKVKSFRIIKQENIGHGQRRIYAVVG